MDTASISEQNGVEDNMNDQERWVSLLQSIEQVAVELQRFPPKDNELQQIREIDRDLWIIQWDCEDNEREEI